MKSIFFILLIVFSHSISNELEDSYYYEPNLKFDLVGLIRGFVVGQINNLKKPEFWGKKLKSLIEKLANKGQPASMGIVTKAVRDCDIRINKPINDEIQRIRRIVGLPPNMNEFFQRNPQWIGKVHNDYEFYEKIIHRPPLRLDAQKENIDQLQRLYKKMDENLELCMDDPNRK